METTIIKRFLQYLFYRDMLLLAAVATHILFYYNLFPNSRILIYSVLGAGTLLWTLYHAQSVLMYFKMKKDAYLYAAVKDEYLTQVKLRAGYHGYIAVFIVCLVFIISGLFFHMLSPRINFPLYFPCEIVLLVTIITDDISKITQLKG